MARNKSAVRTAGSVPKVVTNNRHHDGPKPPHGSVGRGAFRRISASGQLADVLHHDYAGVIPGTEQSQPTPDGAPAINIGAWKREIN